MGHELAVHRKFYRLPEDVTELAKVSKLLLAVENGCASRFKGKYLDDIDMHDLDTQTYSPISDPSLAQTPNSSGENENECMDEECLDLDTQSYSPVSDPSLIQTQTSAGENENKHMDKECLERRQKAIKRKRVKRMAVIVSDSEEEAEDEGPKKVLCKRKSTTKCDLDIEQYDSEQYNSDRDPEFKVPRDESTDVDDSESEMETSRPSKSNPPLKKQRMQWKPEQRSAIEDLILPAVIKNKKPPRKDLVLKTQKQSNCLKNVHWKQIKYNACAMFQQYKKKQNEITAKLLKH
ncbi:uncharacterized protein LOC117315678 isoform X2 [Pecten maximus]|uniref:uncharacterized protein LOC117315678 isoform X2 n=1 Tax=Pecten maximus TaxID=6579 RepID=UPI001458987E|nr:uncharacterized protein LOC117315678 isoform X2 [Pecten maximus]